MFGTREETITAVAELMGPSLALVYDAEAIADDIMRDPVRSMSDMDIVIHEHPKSGHGLTRTELADLAVL